MKLFESEEEAEIKKKQLIESMEHCDEEETREYTSLEINWDSKCQYWDEVKVKNIELMDQPENKKIFFMAHTNETIKGKPQLIHQTIQRIPLLKLCQKTEKEDGKITGYSTKCFFIDDRYDKRNWSEKGVVAMDFWVYKVVDDGKEYYLFSRNKIFEVYSKFKGTKIDLSDLSDLTSTLKVGKISSIFMCYSSEPSIKVIEQDKLIEYSKNLKEEFGWDTSSFQDFIFTHQDGKIYDYTPDFNLLRVSQLLSSKYEGYPLHLMKVGPVGTGKTTEAEVLDFKFQEEQGILEAGSSRMKVLVPSFKEKPANLGYICNCNRIAIIDELMKMIAAVSVDSHQNSNLTSYLGELNMLLEQKRRMVGSGNDNSVIVNSTAKVCITTNPLPGKDTIYQHLNLIDQTTLSRMLIWVQDAEEVEKVYNKADIRYSPEHIQLNKKVFIARQPPLPPDTSILDSVRGNTFQAKIDAFLTIYDSCQQFLTTFDEKRIKTIFQESVELTKSGMRDVWRSRGIHHTILILDGLTKFRCLFKDYDNSFTANDQDYTDLDRIIKHLVKTWDTSFNLNNWKKTINY